MMSFDGYTVVDEKGFTTNHRVKRRQRTNKIFKSSLITIGALLLLHMILTSYQQIFSNEQLNIYKLHRSAPGRGIDLNPLKRYNDLDPDPKHLHKSMYGGVSSDLPICSELGVEILKKGGYAADAAVTVGLCIGLINSFNSGIGGGGYIVSKRYEEDPISIDAREKAPLGAYKEIFKGKEYLSKVGGLAAGIPGEIKGLYTLFSTQGSGKITWKEVIDPVIKLADEGWNVSTVLAAAIAADQDYFRDHSSYWPFVFKEDSSDDIVQYGDHVRIPELANTFRLIAENGSDAIFYDPEGPIASNLIKAANDKGGIFTKQDFLDYNVEVKPALKTEYLGNDVYTCAGSCSGPALISGLNILNHFGYHQGGDMNSVSTHRLIETFKWVASARSRLGDFNGKVKEVISKEWAEKAVQQIKENQTLHSWADYNPAFEINDPHGTTHISIVDQHHNAVSFTSTVNLLFGSLVRDPVTGIILNNQMDDFSVPGIPNAFGVQPSIYNFVRPGKRPLSATVPTIVVNELGKPDLVIGAAGGSRIITTVLQAIVRIYSYSMPILETVSYPRLHHQLLPNYIEHEEHIGNDIIESLKSKGHKTLLQPPKTVLNAIRRWEAEYHAVSDYWRKRGESSVV
ncbi:putative gamma-glutamyltransferase [Wickerhamomyces ciferrii]|uniref:Glutathione hydrolase n=1 Tax=Wickerhamomyces ciferrii (strain ATCC 14091 / BCRC 22168 / CBS 111 / JCM 3599 / NBRC 0793 / NRRL Y-1031 F-60-10) TaxID=1206466 RepID=K0KKT7_WICCF|nr:putative gamma-glutamyltransferase [Wickerhamomyces ciferrii]CCH41728.1 putative gamma-glutamyltransferase [Wickerhamomyces ciferrii]